MTCDVLAESAHPAPPRRVRLDNLLVTPTSAAATDRAAPCSAPIDTSGKLDYCQGPSYLRDLLLYKLTLEARRHIDDAGLSRREIVRRLRTSPAQLHRLLDQTNYQKSIDQVLLLLAVLDCDVGLIVRAKTA
jgi:hypothetical protein